MANQGSIDLNQQAFHQYFAGVALNKDGLQPGETSFRLVTFAGQIRVATSGQFEYDCVAPTQWSVGQQVGVGATTAGAISQQVMPAVTPQAGAIGTAVPGVTGLTSPVSRIVVDIAAVIGTPSEGLQAQVAGGGSGQ